MGSSKWKVTLDLIRGCLHLQLFQGWQRHCVIQQVHERPSWEVDPQQDEVNRRRLQQSKENSRLQDHPIITGQGIRRCSPPIGDNKQEAVKVGI